MTTTTELYQPPAVSSTNNFIASQENPYSALKSTSNDYHSNNPFTAQSQNLTILSEQMKKDDRTDPLSQLGNGATGNGYQKLPFRSVTPHSLVDNDVVDYHLTSQINRLYTQSPQLPRKTYEFNSNMNNSINPSPPPHQLIASQSPYMQRKFPNEKDYGTHYSPYKSLPPQQQPTTFSPVIRKRYQEGHLVSEDLEFRILHGNTSPIVLQRFYHQQNQLKDQKEEDQLRAMRMQSASPNQFRGTPSSIPLKSGSPLHSTRFQHQPAQQMLNRNVFHHHQEPTYNASHKIYESHIPQLQSRVMSNGNGTVPYRHYQQQQNQQPMYDNVTYRAQLACPSSPQLDRLRANLEKPNFYERNQKLPVDIENSFQLDSSMNQSNGAFISDKNKDKGMQAFYCSLL